MVVAVGWSQSCSFLASQPGPAPHPGECTRARSRAHTHTPQGTHKMGITHVGHWPVGGAAATYCS